ncbi:TetR/AcrR family transcriptional regulator [Curtobacterium sp. MCJR17_020]|uniref:TetR/AcrR family transcriptional regulator n=1 Tax=Curtobacterium sp. MCJR17_020 TaxID=2175619 RepID=UPI000DA82097|nr:TetR/AcrR family transcriptional regulator [Curtobacterium sp. MCJR17_020]WIE74151.1 helix-turn-helix domain-containing protein [Curtobacterium sp. MCJR17_020]
MTNPAPRIRKRVDALSREQIVQATIRLLDSSGESALTVRALTEHLSTGRGAIYHYVTGKEELLEAATDGIISAALESTANVLGPRESLRHLALAVFDALTEHRWVGKQLAREPRQPAVLRIWKGIGAGLGRLGVSGSASADAGAALMNYLLGAAAQNAAASHHLLSDSDRQAYLEAFAAELTRSDSDAVSEQTAAALVEHDDREQFVNGLNIFLAGIEAGGGYQRASVPQPTAIEVQRGTQARRAGLSVR